MQKKAYEEKITPLLQKLGTEENTKYTNLILHKKPLEISFQATIKFCPKFSTRSFAYSYADACRQNHNNNTIITSDTVLRKIYLSLYLKGLCVTGSWRPNRTATYWPPTLMAISVSFPFPWAAQLGAWGPSLSGCWFSLPHLISNSSDTQLSIGGLRAPSAGCWLSLPHLISNWLNFLCTELYNSSTSTFFLWASQIALIQPIHGQGYTLLFLDRMHLLFTQVHFLFWQPGRVVGQYTTEE